MRGKKPCYRMRQSRRNNFEQLSFGVQASACSAMHGSDKLKLELRTQPFASAACVPDRFKFHTSNFPDCLTRRYLARLLSYLIFFALSRLAVFADDAKPPDVFPVSEIK